MSPKLTFRLDDLTDREAREQISGLLREIFDIDLAAFNKLGFWPEDYRAFSYLDGPQVVSNVSCFPLPLVIAGRKVMAGGIQSVATRPAYRGRGLFRDLMQRMLAETEAHFHSLLLYTETPDLYEPFGFRVLKEQRFLGRFSSAASGEGRSTAQDLDARDLDLSVAEDVELIKGLFARRLPVSRHLGLCDHSASFFLNALWYDAWRLRFLPAYDALVVFEHTADRLRLLDLVGSQVPPGFALKNALKTGDEPIEVLFPPDCLEGTFEAQAHSDEDAGILMIRGPFAIEESAFLLPPTAAF